MRSARNNEFSPANLPTASAASIRRRPYSFCLPEHALAALRRVDFLRGRSAHPREGGFEAGQLLPELATGKCDPDCDRPKERVSAKPPLLRRAADRLRGGPDAAGGARRDAAGGTAQVLGAWAASSSPFRQMLGCVGGVSADEIRQASYFKLCASEDNPTSMSEPYARTRWRRPFSWVLVDGINVLPQLVTKPKGRPCVVCRTRVKRGVTKCPRCGHQIWPASLGPLPLFPSMAPPIPAEPRVGPRPVTESP